MTIGEVVATALLVKLVEQVPRSWLAPLLTSIADDVSVKILRKERLKPRIKVMTEVVLIR